MSTFEKSSFHRLLRAIFLAPSSLLSDESIESSVAISYQINLAHILIPSVQRSILLYHENANTTLTSAIKLKKVAQKRSYSSLTQLIRTNHSQYNQSEFRCVQCHKTIDVQISSM